MALKLITPPASEPVDATYCKLHMRQSDTSLDTLIGYYITAARMDAELYSNRAMITQTWELILDDLFNGWIELPRPPLVSVTSITLNTDSGSSQAMDLADFVIDTASEPGRICLKEDEYWPNVELQELGGVTIRYVAGYTSASAIPANERLAVAVGVAHLFDNPAGGQYPDLFYNLLNGRRITPGSVCAQTGDTT